MDIKDIYGMQDVYSKNGIVLLKIRPYHFSAFC